MKKPGELYDVMIFCLLAMFSFGGCSQSEDGNVREVWGIVVGFENGQVCRMPGTPQHQLIGTFEFEDIPFDEAADDNKPAYTNRAVVTFIDARQGAVIEELKQMGFVETADSGWPTCQNQTNNSSDMGPDFHW